MLLKKPNTLNYPIVFWNIAKFFQIVFRYLKHLDRLLDQQFSFRSLMKQPRFYKKKKSASGFWKSKLIFICEKKDKDQSTPPKLLKSKKVRKAKMLNKFAVSEYLLGRKFS